MTAPGRIPREVKYSFISITKEALSNTMRHSDATHVSVLIREHPALYQLCIEDNGSAKSAETCKSSFPTEKFLTRTEGTLLAAQLLTGAVLASVS